VRTLVAAELAHLVPQRHGGGRVVAGARCQFNADAVGLVFGQAVIGAVHEGQRAHAQRRVGALHVARVLRRGG